MAEKPTYEELERRVQELEKAESALSLAEDRLKKIFNNSQDAIFIHDQEGKILDVNDKMCRMYRLTKEEALEVNIEDVSSSKMSMEILLEKWQKVLNGEKLLFEWEARRPKDKSVFNVEVSIQKISFRDKDIVLASVRDITEHKRAEEALRVREEKYRLLFNMGVNAIFLIDNNTTQILECNNKASQLFGYSSQELLSMKMTDLSTTPEATRRACQENVSKTERIYRKKNGVLISVDITSEHFYLANRAVHIAAVRDITDKKLAEKALREKTKFLQNIIDTTSDLISVTDTEGNFKFIGPSHSILGYDPDSLVGRNVMEFVHPDDYQKIATAFADFLAKKEDGRTVEYRCRRADGAYLWFETVGKFIFDHNGQPKEILFSSRDFTGRKRTEEALKENEQKFRTIFNSNMDSISLLGIGPDGKPSGFIDCNDAACEVFGYSKEELKLKKLEDLEILVPENVMIQRLESLQTKGSVDFETIIKDKKGRDRYIEVKAVLMDLANQPVIMNISRDITERKQAEAKILYLQKTESLGRMAGAVAHHFNNQLSVVMGNLELVLDDLPNDSGNRENLFQAFEAASKAADQSNQMLRYLGHVSGNQTTINLSRTCSQNLPLLRSTITMGVTLNVDFPDSGPFVQADAGQIQQVLTNLFTNARESISDNQGSINLSIQTVSHEKISESTRFPLDWHPKAIPYACLEISDTGRGISREDIEKLFDPFYTTKFTGRGMGLSVTMGILKAHNGCITVDSEPGNSTVFRVYLPVTTVSRTSK